MQEPFDGRKKGKKVTTREHQKKNKKKNRYGFLILTRLLDGETISDFIQSSCGKTLQAAFLIYQV